jgi:glycosyltransferase involved in cell wall biosynthesis
MLFVVFLLNSILLTLALVNFFTIRRPTSFARVDSSVLVLLPVRNEAENIERILNELEAQAGLSNYKVLVIDDNSEDGTLAIAKKHLSSRISIVSAPKPTKGWLGKVSALQFGFKSAEESDCVISIDADVSFKEDSIARAVLTLQQSRLDFISPYPRQISVTWSERLAQPLLQWSWMSTVLLRGAEKFPMKSTVICNGQFLVMRGASLKAIGGFESVAQKVLDDIELGRSFVSAGYRGAVIDGSALASTRMYSSFDQVRAGYGKSLHTAFGSIFGSLIAALFIAFTGIMPVVYALTGNILAIASLIAIIGSRLVSAAASSTRIRDAWTHPLSSALFLYLLYFSWSNRGKTQWKGRTV